MRQTIAIGNTGSAQVPNRAAAHAAVEPGLACVRSWRASLCRREQHTSLSPFPEGVPAATPAPTACARSVAMVFR